MVIARSPGAHRQKGDSMEEKTRRAEPPDAGVEDPLRALAGLIAKALQESAYSAHVRTTPSSSRMLTPEQAAEILQMGVYTVRRLCARGAIPCVRLGRCWRIPEIELQRFMKEKSN